METRVAKGSRGSSTTNLERFQIAVGIIVSVATVTIGWKTHELTEKTNENNVQLKNIEQQLAETKFGFERVRDIYDRTERYLVSEKQDERRGRALVALIGSLPTSSLRSDLLSIVVREAAASSVAAKAADIQQGRDPTNVSIINPKLDRNSFVGNVSFRFDTDSYTVETLDTFGFKDSNGILWEVPKGKKFDGVSIPRIAWTIIGSPLTGELTASSVLHEHYSQLRTRSPAMVDQMFYEALLKSGVNEPKAKILYNAVRTFGPKWTVVQR